MSTLLYNPIWGTGEYCTDNPNPETPLHCPDVFALAGGPTNSRL
ncbi:MAG: hypothetical protein WAK17_03155 [Candidatus Nitrosopolaris sp.]